MSATHEQLREASHEGARAAWAGATPDERVDRTAAARAGRQRAKAMREALKDRLDAIQVAFPAMSADERLRQLRLLADLAEADAELDAVRRRRSGRPPRGETQQAS